MASNDDISKKFDTRRDVGASEKIGFVLAKVEMTHDTVTSIAEKVDDINNRLILLSSTAVKQEECTQRTRLFMHKVDQLRDEIAKKQTRDNPSLASIRHSSQIMQAVNAGEIEITPKKSWKTKIKEHLTIIIMAGSVLGLLIAGVVKFAHVIVNVEAVMNEQTKANKESMQIIKKELKNIKTIEKANE